MRRAVSRFRSWERSFWHWTTIPLERWVIQLRQFLPLLLFVHLVEARPQDAKGRVAVPQLGALVLALDDDPAGEVGDPHRGVSGVAPLAPRSRRAEDVDPEVLVPDHDLHV